MRVFVTGASGYIGSAVVRSLVAAGHEVSGLYHTAERERLVKALGAMPVRGNLRDLETYQHFAAECDVTIHTAIDGGPEAAAYDFEAVEGLLGALGSEGGRKAFIYTSGVWVLGDTGGQPASEDAAVNPTAIVAWRPPHERRVLDGASEFVTTAVVRPGIVYGERRGFISGFFAQAQSQGRVTFVGEGRNRWPLVHRDDLAELYRLVAERRASGVFHGVAGPALPVEEVARACCEAAGCREAVQGRPLAEARAQLGMLADALCLDQPVVTRRAQEVGWQPARASFRDAARDAFAEWRSAG